MVDAFFSDDAVLQPAGRLRWHDFGDGWVVYSTATGGLRHVDAVDAVLLDQLEQAPSSVAALERALEQHTEQALDAAMREGLVQRLHELTELGLVMPVAAVAQRC